MALVARHFCFTLNNPPSNEINWTLPGDVRYAVWQLERGETRQTPHLQGYVEFSKPVSSNRIKNLLGRAVHLEQRRGTRTDARDYCMKLESRVEGPWEYGTWDIGGQGRRTDIDEVLDLVEAGQTERDIYQSDRVLWARHYKIIERAILLNCPQRDWRTKLILVTGDPGSGKSTYCRKRAGDAAYYKDDTTWWPGYEGQEAVVFDEFEGSLDITTINRICDAYPLVVQVKGSGVSFTSKKVYINSNHSPDEWHKWNSVSHYKLRSFSRRVDEWLMFRNIDLIFIEVTHISFDVEAPGHPEISRQTHRFDISQGWEEMNTYLYPPDPLPLDNLNPPQANPPNPPEGGTPNLNPLVQAEIGENDLPRDLTVDPIFHQLAPPDGGGASLDSPHHPESANSTPDIPSPAVGGEIALFGDAAGDDPPAEDHPPGDLQPRGNSPPKSKSRKRRSSIQSPDLKPKKRSR